MTSTAEVRPSTITTPAPTSTPRAAPHRLRELDRSGWLVAGVIVVLLALPWVASYWRAQSMGYTLSSDDALIGLRVHDVFSTHPPFIGQPSTAAKYNDKAAASHPGPIEFYLLAIPMNVFGPDAGALIGAGIFTFGSVLVALWVVLRRAGPGVALAAAVVFAGLAWAQGPAVLTDILSSIVGGIPLLGLAVLGWAVMDGDIRLLPLAAFFFSFVAQQHLAILALGLGGGLWVALGAARYAVRWRWDQRASRTGVPEEHWARWRWSRWFGRVIDVGDRPDEPPKRWIRAAIGVTVLAWLPVFTEAVVHKGGNLWRIATFGGTSGNAKLGLAKGIGQALRALGLPPLLLRTNLDGYDLRGPIGPLAVVVGLAVAAALVAVVVHFWRSQTHIALLALTTLVMTAVGALNGAQVPNSGESWRVNFWRWMFVVSALTWLTLGWAAVRVVAERRARSRAATSVVSLAAKRRSWQFGAIGAVLIVSLLACFASGPRVRRDETEYRADRQIAAAVRASVAGDHRVLIDGVGYTAGIGSAESLALKLTNAGHQVYVASSEAGGYGKSRALGTKRYDTAIWIVSSPTPPARLPGKQVLSIDLDAARAHAIAQLARNVRGQKLVLSPDADQILKRVGRTKEAAAILGVAAATVTTHPTQVLSNQSVAKVIQQGYFESPKFDQGLIDKLATLPQQSSWGDRYIVVWQLTPEQVHQRFPSLH